MVAQGNLAAWRDHDLGEFANGLPRRGQHPTHAVDLVAKELDTHRCAGLGGIDVDGIAMHVEGARHANPARIAGVDVTHAHEQACRFLEGDLVSHRERARGKVARAHGGHAAQQRAGTRHHQAVLPRREARDGVAACADHRIVRRLVGPWPVATLGIAADDAGSQPGGKCASRTVRSLLARDHEQAGTRVVGPKGRKQEGSRALGYAEGSIVARTQVCEQGRELWGREELLRHAVDEHRIPIRRRGQQSDVGGRRQEAQGQQPWASEAKPIARAQGQSRYDHIMPWYDSIAPQHGHIMPQRPCTRFQNACTGLFLSWAFAIRVHTISKRVHAPRHGWGVRRTDPRIRPTTHGRVRNAGRRRPRTPYGPYALPLPSARDVRNSEEAASASASACQLQLPSATPGTFMRARSSSKSTSCKGTIATSAEVASVTSSRRRARSTSAAEAAPSASGPDP